MNPFDYIPSYIPNPSEAGLIIGAGIIGLLIVGCGVWFWLIFRAAKNLDEHSGTPSGDCFPWPIIDRERHQ